MDKSERCEPLPWDSDFFGCSIARVIGGRLTSNKMARVMEWCRARSIDCLYFLADSEDPQSVRLAEDNRFGLVDIRVTLERTMTEPPPNEASNSRLRIRASTAQDLAALRAIARVSHRDTRFYSDGHFPTARCDALYETWIEKSIQGYADAVLVGDANGDTVGYVSCHRRADGTGQIGLLGVSEGWQGQGLGKRLIIESLRWFADYGMTRVSVVTQGRNCRAQRQYQRSGFLTQMVQLWYHRWFLPSAAGTTT